MVEHLKRTGELLKMATTVFQKVDLEPFISIPTRLEPMATYTHSKLAKLLANMGFFFMLITVHINFIRVTNDFLIGKHYIIVSSQSLDLTTLSCGNLEGAGGFEKEAMDYEKLKEIRKIFI